MKLLHANILGSGEPLLILHGFLGSGDNWKTLANVFAESFEVHLIDQRNHGRSFHSDDFDYDLMVEDLLYYMDHHQIAKAHVLGHSMGGKTSMLFAVSHEERVMSLTVADISPRYYPPHHHAILEGLNAVDFSIQNSRKLVGDRLAEFVPEMGVRQFLLRNVYWREKGVLDFRFHLSALTEHYDEVGVALPSFTSYSGDALFLKGANSGYISSEDVSLIQAHFPKASIETIANAGHWLHAENPDDFSTVVHAFLRKLS